MNKIFIIGLLSLFSATTMANTWQDQSLILQYSDPQSMGAPVEYHSSQSEINKKHQSSFIPQYALSFGYAGSRIGSNELGGNKTFNGAFLNSSASLSPKLGVYAEYLYQKASDVDFDEIGIGMQYKLMENRNAYTSAGFGIGYAWLDESQYDPEFKNLSLELQYITLPIDLEVGYNFSPTTFLFGRVGYKWLFNHDMELCFSDTCLSGSHSELDIDGVTYKAGLRYNF